VSGDSSRKQLSRRWARSGLELDLAGTDGDALATDAERCDAIPLPARDGDVDEARSPDLYALLAHERGDGLARQEAPLCEVRRERASGGTGRRIFRDAQAGREHAAVGRRPRVLALRGEGEDVGVGGAAEH